MTIEQRRWHVRLWLMLTPLLAIGLIAAMVAARSAAP